MISLEERGVTPMRQVLTVLQETDGNLACYPNLNKTTNGRVKYYDYQAQLRQWIHIACVFDNSTSLIRGMLYQEKDEFLYFSDIPLSASFGLTPSNFNLYLNLNSRTMTRGSPQSLYAEFRFWSDAKSFQEISALRYQ
jgi:hypothetical protein